MIIAALVAPLLPYVVLGAFHVNNSWTLTEVNFLRLQDFFGLIIMLEIALLVCLLYLLSESREIFQQVHEKGPSAMLLEALPDK